MHAVSRPMFLQAARIFTFLNRLLHTRDRFKAHYQIYLMAVDLFSKVSNIYTKEQFDSSELWERNNVLLRINIRSRLLHCNLVYFDLWLSFCSQCQTCFYEL